MGTTYLKRQKEMKRLEKQREKAERRAQKKIANRAQNANIGDDLNSVGIDTEAPDANLVTPPEPDPQN